MISTQSTTYPKGYNILATRNKNSKKFTESFNQWALDIRESTLPQNSVMYSRLKEAKQLINSK